MNGKARGFNKHVTHVSRWQVLATAHRAAIKLVHVFTTSLLRFPIWFWSYIIYLLFFKKYVQSISLSLSSLQHTPSSPLPLSFSLCYLLLKDKPGHINIFYIVFQISCQIWAGKSSTEQTTWIQETSQEGAEHTALSRSRATTEDNQKEDLR